MRYVDQEKIQLNDSGNALMFHYKCIVKCIPVHVFVNHVSYYSVLFILFVTPILYYWYLLHYKLHFKKLIAIIVNFI